MADPISQQGLYQDGNSIFENVHILGTLEVTGIVNTETNLTAGPIKSTGSITATKFLGDGSELTGIDATTIKDSAGTVRIQGTTTGATHSGRAVINELEIESKLYDGDGNFGTSGQVLSSDGTDTAWINAGSLTAGAAAEVGVSAASANANHFITMVDTASGNENIRVDTDLTYNPVTNTLNVPNISGNGSGLSGIESFVTGMIILWYGNTGNIPTGFVLCDGNNSTPDLRDRFVVGAGSAYSPNNTGGSSSITLAESQLPSHNHSATSTVTDPGHSHTWDRQDVSINNGYRPWPANNNDCSRTTANTGSQTTGITVSTTIGNTGSGSAIENRPPYYALCYIMKT